MMRTRRSLLLVLLPLTAWGCSGDSDSSPTPPGGQDAAVAADGGSDALPEASDKETEPVDCKPEKAISTQAEVEALIGTEWSYGNIGTSSGLPVTSDLRASTALTLDADAIPMPTNCDSQQCGDHVLFYGQSIAGVTLETPGGQSSNLYRYLKAEAGAAFRLRPLVQDNHPLFPPRVAILQVLEPCTTPCPEGTQRCPGDTLCYFRGESYCLSCEGRKAPFCACESETGTRPDGESCFYQISGDQMAGGKCLAGECK